MEIDAINKHMLSFEEFVRGGSNVSSQEDEVLEWGLVGDDNERIAPKCCPDAHWRRDWIQGDRVCTGCGRCVLDNMVHSFRLGTKMGSQYATIYHLHERFTMVNLVDSSIPMADFTKIREAVRRSRFGGRPVRNRWDVQRVLRGLNTKHRTQQYTKKWLERWMQILNRTQGFEPPKISYEEILKVDVLWRYARTAWIARKPDGRRHVPNVSYLIVQMLALIGRSPVEMIPWFPQLKTHSILEKTEAFWAEICQYNRWPFISIIPQMQLLRRNKIRVD